MYKTESSYRGDYAKTSVDKILNNLHEYTCLTVLAPSGFGKSYILRYLAYNNNYRSRFRNLRKVEFIYIDTREIILEKENAYAQSWIPNDKRELEALGSILYKSVLAKIKDVMPAVRMPADYNKDNLLKAIEKLLNHNSSKRYYVIFDEAEKLFDCNKELVADFLNFIRERHRNQIEYMLAINNSKWLEMLGKETERKFANLFFHKVVIFDLADVTETHRFDSYGLSKIWSELVIRRTAGFKAKMRQLNQLSGGYLPYAKHLRNLSSLKSVTLNDELLSDSKRLLNSLTVNQQDIMFNIAHGAQIAPGPDFNYLLQTGLVKHQNGKYSLFSPIMEAFLKLTNQGTA